MPELSPELIAQCLLWFLVFVFSTTLHEAAHAFAALRMGDETAYAGGQVSLNPIPHIAREPMGMVAVPLISFFLVGGNWMIGWASAPYDPRWAANYPRRAAIMALAGPASNLLLVIASGIAIRVGAMLGYLTAPSRAGLVTLAEGTDAAGSAGVAAVLGIVFGLNLVLFLFNLLPLPPMDGSAAIQLFMSEDMARRFQTVLYQPMWSLVGLLVAWRFFGVILGPVFGFALNILYPGMYR